MAVRIKESIPPYKGGTGIEITNNHIINVLLREANNLIHVNENNELYVDLQLDDGIAPDDDFPVGVTTGRILQEDGWQQSGLILNWKTTSGDYNRLIYANDGNLYIDYGDGVWHLIGSGGSLLDCNTRTFYLSSLSDLTNAQLALDWYNGGKNPILWYDNHMFTYWDDFSDGTDPHIRFVCTEYIYTSRESKGTGQIGPDFINVYFTGDTVTRIQFKDHTLNDTFLQFIPTNVRLRDAFMATQDSHPISKKYLDLELAKKQDLLTAGTRISINVDPNTGETIISADISGAMTYKGNVTDPTQLPSSGNTQGDCWYSESDGHLYAWDGTQWKDVGGSGMTYFAGHGIDINGSNTVTNTLPFEPDNQGATGEILKKTQNGYEWSPESNDTYSAGQGINIDANNEISNTGVLTVNNSNPDANGNIDIDEFSPENQGTMGQVLQKTNGGYRWVNPTTGYGAGHGINIDQNNNIENTLPFEPDNTGTTGQVLKKTPNGYEWANESGGGTTYSAGAGINIDSNNEISNTGVLTINNASPDTNGNINVQGVNYLAGNGIAISSNNTISNTKQFDPSNSGQSGQILRRNSSGGYYWDDESGGGGGQTYYGGDYISIDSNNEINNTAPFIPGNGTVGQVLRKTQNGYEWSNENALPSGGTAGQVLVKTQSGYGWSEIELPSGENNVKFWTIDSSNVSSTVLQEIIDWVSLDLNNGAVINDVYTNDVFIFHDVATSGGNTSATFYGKKRITQATTLSGTHAGEQITTGYEQRLIINTYPNIFCTVDSNPDDSTHTNYISAIGANYTTPFMPQSPGEPATKAYVDAVAAGTVQTPAITNNTSGTTYTITQVWKGTQAQYNALSSKSNTILYIIV